MIQLRWLEVDWSNLNTPVKFPDGKYRVLQFRELLQCRESLGDVATDWIDVPTERGE